MLSGPLVELGQLRPERGEPSGEIIGSEPCLPYTVEGVRSGEQGLPGALDGGREPGELRLGLPEQRSEPLTEPVQVLLDPAQLVLGGGQLGAGARGDRRLELVPVEVVGVDGLDVLLTGLVDASAQRLEVGDGAAGRGGVVDGGDGLDRDPQIALGGVQLVEGGRGGVLRGLRLGPLTLGAPAEPAPGAATGEGGGQGEGGEEGRVTRVSTSRYG